MEALAYLEDVTQIVFDKTYLLVHVDEYQVSTPFINTGFEILKSVIYSMRDRVSTVGEEITETNFYIEEFTIEDFKVLLGNLSIQGITFSEELNEIGYSIYELNV